ncbi:MAG TPA: STAS domain-containing protein [Solirubrobacteraceae bacterium]|nr:STAS domain-containing protein [Solirubrobacteraceae bacterium]
MERYLIPEDDRGITGRLDDDPSARLAHDFGRALLAEDVAHARRLISRALADGAAPGRLYVDVVRPGFSGIALGGVTIRDRLLAVACRAIIAEFVGALPGPVWSGPRRAALLSSRRDGIERVDGDLAIDFLEADGWGVQRLHGPRSALALGPAARPESVELAVAVVSGAQDALLLAPACTLLRRLPDPPVVILCDFTGRPGWSSAATTLGADAFVSDPEELVLQAGLHLPPDGVRRWGVQISRRADALVLTPTGRLDVASAARLADVVRSRLGSFARVVIDLRDLAEISSAGIQDVQAWVAAGPLHDVELRFLGDSAARARIDALGMSGDIKLENASAS